MGKSIHQLRVGIELLLNDVRFDRRLAEDRLAKLKRQEETLVALKEHLDGAGTGGHKNVASQ